MDRVEQADPYDRLLTRWRRISRLRRARGLLNWDWATDTPADAIDCRPEEIIEVKCARLRLLAADETQRLVTAADADATDAEQDAVLREVAREHERVANVPERLVRAVTADNLDLTDRNDAAGTLAETAGEGLVRTVELKSSLATATGGDGSTYETLFASNEPYLTLDDVDPVLGRIRAETTPLCAARKRDADTTSTDPFAGTGPFDEDVQLAALSGVLDAIGADHDRLTVRATDGSFTVGSVSDVRIGVRLRSSTPLPGVLNLLHELGHARYLLDLPTDDLAPPLAEPRSQAMNEAVAWFWEFHVGRTTAFWERMAGVLERHLSDWPATDPAALRAAAADSYPDGPVPVADDELRHLLYGVIESEVERALLDEGLAPEDAPRLWQDRLDDYLNGAGESVDRKTVRSTLQSAVFGVSLTYVVGAVLAAQFAAAIAHDVAPVETLVRRGEFDAIHDWFTESVFRHGKRYETPELVRRATGESLTATHLIEHLEARIEDGSSR